MGTHGVRLTDRSTESFGRAWVARWHLTCLFKLWEGNLRLIVVTFRALACPVLLLLLAGDAGLVSQAWAQTPPTTSTPPPDATLPPDLDLSRIRMSVQEPLKPNLFNDGRVRFYAQTEEKMPSFSAFSKGFNLTMGPVPGAGMTHAEFLGLVTPKYLYSSGGINAMDQLQWGVVNTVAVWTVKRLYRELSEARTDARKKQIQEQIDRELAALRGGK